MRIFKTVLKIVLGLVLALVLAIAAFALTLRAKPPSTTFEPRPASAAPADPRPVLVFGATGGTGYEIVKLLRERGQPVTAAVRASSNRSELEPLGVAFVVADAMDAPAVRAAFATAGPQAVISTIGCLRCEDPPDFVGNRNIIDAAKEQGVRRVILVTTVGAGDSRDTIPFVQRAILGSILSLKTQAEDHLRATGLDYTIIRPGGLRPPSNQPTGSGYLSEDRAAMGWIHRADLAQLIVAVLDDERTIGKTFTVADPTLKTPWQ